MRCSPKKYILGARTHTSESMEWSPQVLSSPLEGSRLLLCLCFDLENPWMESVKGPCCLQSFNFTLGWDEICAMPQEFPAHVLALEVLLSRMNPPAEGDQKLKGVTLSPPNLLHTENWGSHIALHNT